MKTSSSSLEPLEARIAPATFRWNLTGSGTWNASASWFNETSGTANNGFPNAADDVAKLTSATAASATVTVNAANTLVGSIIFDEATNFFVTASGAGSLLLGSSTAAAITVTTANGSGGHAMGLPVALASPLTIAQGSATAFTVQGAVNDGGFGLTKNGVGQLIMQPAAANTITGTTTVSAGTLLLNSANATLGGPVSIGGAGATAQLTSTSGNLLADTAPVTVGALGTYALAFQETIGALTINDGTVSFSGGSALLNIPSLAMTGGLVQMNVASQGLTIGGNISVTASASSSAQILGGSVSLSAATSTIDVPAGPSAPTFTITSQIGTAGSAVKTGTGSLSLGGTGANFFTTGMTVNGGLLLLGKTAGIAAVSGSLTIGDGLGGADAGAVRLFSANQIPDTTVVTINSSGLLDLNGNSETFATLNVTGGRATTGSVAADLRVNTAMSLNAAHLEAQVVGSRIFLPTNPTVPAGATGGSLIDGLGSAELVNVNGLAPIVSDTPDDFDLTIALPINGGVNAVLNKSGAGTLALDAVNTYGGTTSLFQGGLRVDGRIGALTLSGGDGTSKSRLIGSGTIGTISSSGAGTYFISPASTGNGTLNTGSILSATSEIFTFDLNGTGAGQSDALAVTGTVNLTGSTQINLRLNYVPAAGDTFTIIDNDGADAIAGSFLNTFEGRTITVGAVDFRISYLGGDGNDVTLTAVTPLVIDGSTPFPGQTNNLTIQLKAGDPTQLEYVFFGGQSKFIPAANVQRIVYLGGIGLDAVTMDFTNGLIITPLVLDGGGGSQDSLRIADNANVLLQTSYQLGGASESSFVFLSGTGDGVQITITGVEGIVDTATPASSPVNWNIAVADVRVRFQSGKSVQVNDSPTVFWSGQLDSLILGDFGTTNHYYIDYTGFPFQLGGIAINAAGGDDTLTLTGSAGDDNITLTSTQLTATSPLFSALPPVTLSGLASIELLGGLGNDVFNLTAAGTTARIVGGAGNDIVTFANAALGQGLVLDIDLLGAPQTINAGGARVELGDLIENFVGTPLANAFHARPSLITRTITGLGALNTLTFDAAGADAKLVNGDVLTPGFGTLDLTGVPTVTLLNVPAKPVLGAQGNTFAAPLDFDAGKGALSIATGDLNGDGRADFVTADSKGGTVSIALSTTTGLLLPAVQKLTGGVKPTGVVLANFDGINGLDIAVTNATTGNVGILLNDGAGNFGDATPFLTGKTPGVLRVGDLDGDTKLDLATIIAGNKIAILKGNGDGTFAAATTLASGAVKPRDLALADLDTDTDLDLVVLHTGGQLATHVNDGTASFTAPVIAKAGAGATALAIADFNGDGKLDAAVTHSVTSRYIAVLLGQGNATFLPMLRVAYPLGSKAAALVASDFDGDGITDLAIANGAGGRVSILRGLGNGGFVRALDLTLEDTPPRKLAALALGDFDGDGRLDIAGLSSGSSEVSIVTRA